MTDFYKQIEDGMRTKRKYDLAKSWAVTIVLVVILLWSVAYLASRQQENISQDTEMMEEDPSYGCESPERMVI